MAQFEYSDVDTEHRVRLQGSYARGVWLCPECGHDHWPEDETAPDHWLGMAEARGQVFVVRECENCFAPFYHHDKTGAYYENYVRGDLYDFHRRKGNRTQSD